MQPDEFIPLAEETGLIAEIGKWVLGKACAQGAEWRAAGYLIGIAVNVSARQLDTDQFVSDVEDALTRTGLDPAALTLEITETTLMRNVEETARRLGAVKELGVRVAIDDFGTGYSSLAHLQRFPVDALKIDRSFIAGLSKNREGETLIHTLVQLGKALSIETFAEGIEQQQQLSSSGMRTARAARASSTRGHSTSPRPRRSCAAGPRTAPRRAQLKLGHLLAPGRRSIPASEAITIVLTISGANRPCSIRPGVALSLIESSRGSPTGPR